jgi:hypothetical protein
MSQIHKFREILTAPLRRGFETNHDIRNTVFLAGCGRSGTTWLSEILNADGRYRYIFEPFNRQKTAVWSQCHFHQYLPRAASEPEILHVAASILSGRVHSRWVDSQNHKLIASRRLVKDTRANLMLGWMRGNFPEMPIILLTRHPLAVTMSRMKLGWGPAMSIQDIAAQPDLLANHLAPYTGLLERLADDEFSMQIANWCISHMVPLKELDSAEYCLLRYESLILDPEAALARVFDYLGLPLTQIHKDRLERASATASRSTRRARDQDALSRPWKNKLPEDQIRRAADIIEDFGLSSFLEILPTDRQRPGTVRPEH